MPRLPYSESGGLTVHIEQSIILVRGEKVIVDHVLAEMYGVTTKALMQAVQRNRARFPGDFMYQLSLQEVAILKSQFVTSSSWGGRRKLSYVFTEQGVAMLSSVLRSERAVRVNVEIMRAFVRLRRLLASHADLARKLDELEKKYDEQSMRRCTASSRRRMVTWRISYGV